MNRGVVLNGRINQMTRKAGVKPDPPPAQPLPMMAYCDNCKQWVSVVESGQGGYVMPTHGATGLAPTCIKAEISITDCYVKRPKLPNRIMNIAQQLTEESKSLDGMAKAIVLEAIARLALASTFLEE